mgnify:CR=1 FL=1
MAYNKTSPLISVIVPIYNEEEYVGQCIESIINQSYVNLEIILVDDGSADKSGQICDEYMLQDKRIKVIHKNNGGLVSSRKAGLQIATGGYAAFVDGDDWIEPDMYERLISQIRDADIVVSGVIRDYRDRSICKRSKMANGYYLKSGLEEKIYPHMMYTGRFYEEGILPNIYTSLYKRELLLKNQMQVPDDVRLGEDAACLYPTMLDAGKVVLISDCLYHYRIRKGSLMDVIDGDDLWRFKIVYQYLQSRFCEYDAQKENLFWQLDYMMVYWMMLKEFKILQSGDGLFPYSGVCSGDRIIVYGTGRFGKILMNYIESQDRYTIVDWVDGGEKGKKIEYIESCRYDYIVIAVLMQDMTDDIKKSLVSKGISDDKIKTVDLQEIEVARKRLKNLL